MSDGTLQGLYPKSLVTEDEIAEIVQLYERCKQQDHLSMSPPLDDLRERSAQEVNDFLYYDQGQLVGYLYAGWGTTEKEITGMVAPTFRRQGIFRQLYEAARAEYQRRGARALVLICERDSPSGHAFARAVGAKLDFSEHAMELGDFAARHQHDPAFQMRPATPEDKEALIAIMATDSNEQHAREYVESLYQTPRQEFYLSTLADQPLGMLRLDYQKDAVGLYGFIVRPEYRGKGLGRQMLEYIVPRIRATSTLAITLEVETTNQNALGLYNSCGFQVKTTYDYFIDTI